MSFAQEGEVERIRARYARRAARSWGDLAYGPLRADMVRGRLEKERALAAALRPFAPVAQRRLLDVGCGEGYELLNFIVLGFWPEHLVGVELLPDAVATARNVVPARVRIVEGDAAAVQFEPSSFDVVYQSTVFTSILSDHYAVFLAERLWSWVRPGGMLLWYDFIYDNPENPDVRGYSLRKIRGLFPQAEMCARRLTLAPPIARRVPDALAGLLGAVPLLRTHVLVVLKKPSVVQEPP